MWMTKGQLQNDTFLSDPSPIIGKACHSLTNWLTDWLTHWLTDWLTDWRPCWRLNELTYTIWSSRCCFICYRLFHVHLLCKIIRHTKAGSVWKQHSFFRTEMEKREKTIACTTTLPGACWFGGGSLHRSRSSCWGWRWPAWTWCRTSLWGTGDRALTRGWSCWLWTIFARWWSYLIFVIFFYTSKIFGK